MYMTVVYWTHGVMAENHRNKTPFMKQLPHFVGGLSRGSTLILHCTIAHIKHRGGERERERERDREREREREKEREGTAHRIAFQTSRPVCIESPMSRLGSASTCSCCLDMAA